MPSQRFAAVTSIILAIALAAPTVAASAHTDRIGLSPTVHRLVVKQASSPHARQPASTDDRHADRHRPPATVRMRSLPRNGTSDRRAMWRAIALQDRAQQRQRAQISARAERRYALSQTSAPILTDTRACKRVGPQGQSIYENCALAGDGVVVGAH